MGEWLALLGEEQDGWGAFGGGPESSDRGSRVRTATREAIEESHGLLPSTALRRAARGTEPLVENAEAVVYGVFVPHVLQTRMNKLLGVQNALKTRLDSLGRTKVEGCFEKESAEWVPLSAFVDKKLQRGSSVVCGKWMRVPLNIDVHSQKVRRILKDLEAVSLDKDWEPRRIKKQIERRNKICGFRNSPRGPRLLSSSLSNYR